MSDGEPAPASPALIQFLGNRVREVLATQSYAQQPWTQNRVASYITGSLDIEGTMSAATLGRFLDPANRQHPKQATVRAVRDFLLYHRYLTPRQLEWAEGALSIRSGLSLAAFFEVPDTKAQGDFLRELEGEYRAVEARAPFFLRARLHLNYLDEIGMLTATEVIGVFGAARCESDFRAEFVATGQALAFTDLIAIFLKGEPDGFSSILNVGALTYDDEDRVVALGAWRNAGWKSLGTKEIDVPPLLRSDTPARGVARLHANDPQHYWRFGAEEIALEAPAGAQSPSERRDFHGAAKRGELTEDFVQKLWDEAATPDDKLRVAMDYWDLELFKRALREGGDPNGIPQGFDIPFIHIFARGGRAEWAQAILDDPRCRITIDNKGLTPSFHAGVLARHVAGAPGADDLAKRWGDLHRLLLARELEQGILMQPDLLDPNRG